MGLERIAVNINHTDKPDNEGNRSFDERIRKEGPPAYFSNYPVQALLSGLKHASVPITLSFFAGTYLCNHAFYGLMDFIQLNRPSVYGGFMHVPLIHEQQALYPDRACFDKGQLVQTTLSVVKTLLEVMDMKTTRREAE
jgi:pyroglutamyl-peptidase